MNTIPYEAIATLPDSGTDPRLLPLSLVPRDNEAEMDLRRVALRVAVERRLTAQQREVLDMLYQQGMTKTQVAAALEVMPSTVSKWDKGIREVLKDAVEFCLLVRREMGDRW